MKILFVGATWRGSNAQSYRRAFERLGHEVVAVDPETMLARYGKSLFLRVCYRVLGGPLPSDRSRIRASFVRASLDAKPDLVFVAKGIWLKKEDLDRVRAATGAILVHWHPDDYRNPANTSTAFQEAIPAYDLHVTPKSFNVAELESDGARRVVYLPYAYDPEVHRPVPPDPALERDVVFVGSYENERARFMEFLASRGVELSIWGGGWKKLSRRSPLRPCCRFRQVLAEDMAQVFASSKLCLGFLRKVNRDRHTARTFEIPACGGAMLAERSDEQLEFFREDVEALYFGNEEELLDKVRFYLKREDFLERLRAAALERCRTSPYRYEDRARAILEEVS
jgi:spore maturation protein CgeB